jgi:hypothetical protein
VEPSENGQEAFLVMDWQESGVVMPAEGAVPRGSGFGRELIEQALPYELDAETSYVLGPDGVHCTVRLPIADHAAHQEVAHG